MRLLLDCDGVIADWTGAVAEVVRKHGGVLDEHSWFERGDLPAAIRNKVMAEIAAPGFCFKFAPLPGAKEAVAELLAAGCEVHFVTSLWDCPTWVYDRNRWLRKHGFAKKAPAGVTYTKDKWVVKGDIFVDDKIGNVVNWSIAWPNGTAILWAQKWNFAYVGQAQRFNDWNKLIGMATQEKIAA